jgi:multidrug resistance efflux pump
MVDEFDQLEEQGRRSRVRAIIVNLFVLAAGLLVGYYLLQGTQEVTVLSRVWSEAIRIYARQDGKIKTINFTETESFRQGDLLFEIEDPVLESQIEATSKSIDLYEARIEQEQSDLQRRISLFEIGRSIEDARQQIKVKEVEHKSKEAAREAARERLTVAQDKLERAQDLVSSGVLTQTQLEPYRLAVQTARDAVRVVDAEIDLIDETVSGLERKIADMEKHRADMTSATARVVAELTDLKAREESKLAELRSRRSLLKYYADLDGIVAARHKTDLESVRAGELVLEVTAGENIWVDAYLQPEDSKLVKQGDRVEVRYQDQPFQTIVAWKNLKAVLLPWRTPSLDGREERYIQVRLSFIDPGKAEAAGLLPGIMVDTILERREGFLYRLGLRPGSDSAPTTAPMATTP